MINYIKKILVVDDEEKIVEVVESYLEKEGYIVYKAYNGKQAFELFNEIKPALIVLDLMLPDISGEEICKELRKKSRVPIIMLTAKVEETDILKGLGIGADDYVTKPFSPKQLVARVKALLRRTEDDINLLANVMTYNNGKLEIDSNKHEVRVNGEPVNLTPAEYKTLITLAKHPSKAYTRYELIDTVIGEEFTGYDRVIDTHIKNLRQKTEVDPKNPKYILTVHGIGYKFGGE